MKNRIVIPEYNSPEVRKALKLLSADIEIINGENLENSLKMLAAGAADGMVTGLDYTTRDVILACRDILGATGETFSSCVYFENRITGQFSSILPLILEAKGWNASFSPTLA